MSGKAGYLFNKYEIAYISRMMGASYITNIGIELNESPDIIAYKANKSLIEKNYVFKNFNGELVLNKEFVNYFKPFVSPSGIISCRRFIDNVENNFIFFTKNRNWLCMENDIFNNGNYILTYSDEYNSVKYSLEEIVQTNKNDEDTSAFRFVISSAQYHLIKDIVKKKDREKLISILNMAEVKYDDDIISEVEKICCEDADIISIVFFGDYKHNLTNMKYLIYYPTDKYVWKIDAGENESITISRVTQDDINNNISFILNTEFGISSKKRAEMFL